MDGDAIQLKAPCKVNLFLRVVGRRPDGYHELETWMQKLDLYDDIELRITHDPGIWLVCDEPGVPVDETNLAWKAAQAFFSRSTRAAARGVEITLVKRIPAAAGLGGGSSDAGTVLRGLNTYFGGEFADDELIEMAVPLGADVPFFVTEHSAVLARGIGERMESVPPLTGCSLLLVNPGFSVSTKWVFETFALTTENEPSIMPRFRKQNADRLSVDDMFNDLESVTSREFPEVEQMKNQLLEAGASRVLMSGSGPTVFGVFPDGESGQVVSDAADKLRLRYKDRVFITRSCAGAWPSGQGTGF